MLCQNTQEQKQWMLCHPERKLLLHITFWVWLCQVFAHQFVTECNLDFFNSILNYVSFVQCTKVRYSYVVVFWFCFDFFFSNGYQNSCLSSSIIKAFFGRDVIIFTKKLFFFFYKDYANFTILRSEKNGKLHSSVTTQR